MKSLSIIVLLSLFIVSCGPSQKEIENIAKAACSEIMATRKFEEARRIRILNEALEELGRDPYYSSSLFETRIALGGTSACMDILNPPPPPTAEEIEQQRIEEERREKIAEENRIEREKEALKRAEEKRIREEQERIANEERERKEAEQRRIAEEKRLEEKRLKEEQERLEQERKLKEKEERRKYVKNNTETTYLYCPSETKTSRRSEIPKWFYGLKVNKLDDEYLISDFYTSDQWVTEWRVGYSSINSCKDIIQENYKYEERYPSDEFIYYYELEAIEDAKSIPIGTQDNDMLSKSIDRRERVDETYGEDKYKLYDYLEYRRLLKGAQSDIYSFTSQDDQLLNGTELQFCERVGEKIYSMYFIKAKPEFKKRLITKKEFGGTRLEEIFEDKSTLKFGPERELNRETLTTGYTQCEIVSEEEFSLKVLEPLEKKFNDMVDPIKASLEKSTSEIDSKI
tara:strand:+ start:669 stop:2039 length:1371 start_codon:yes stop_codon:yes gene_type:complete